MSREDESNLPAILIALAGIVALLAGGGYYIQTKRSQAMWMARSAEFEALAAADALRHEETLWKHEETIQDVVDAKLLCEQNARLVKKMAGSQPDKEKALLTKGEELYSKAKKSSDSCLDYLIGAIKRRFENLEPAELTKRMKEARASNVEFVNWSDNALKSPTEASGFAGPWDLVLENYPNWFSKFHPITYGDDDLDQIVSNLETCRMKSWNDIK
jgi:hypothetical protein